MVARGTSEDPGAEQNADPASPASAGNRDPAGTAHLQRPAEPRALQAVQSARRLAARIGSWCRARPLVAVAVGLLGLGGVIYPPVWVLGAILALFLQAWDYRDKWIGLALPIVLTVIGSAFGVAAGGGHGTFGHNVHDGWMFAVIISRITAVLGAGYLAWRTVHQRRPPEIPPWNKPRKVP